MTADRAELPATRGGTRCPVCGATVAPSMDIGAFRLFACAGCGSWCSDALLHQVPTSFEPERYFSTPDADRPKWQNLLDRLRSGQRTFGSILDVGCGSGAFLAFLRNAQPGTRQAGIELDAARAAHARLANPDAVIQSGDAATVLDSIPGQFDLITLWDVLEHVPEPAALLGHLAAKLASGGRMFVQTIHEDSVVPRLGRLSYRLTGGRLHTVLRRTHDAHHLVFFTEAGMARLAADAGLAITERWFDRLAMSRMDGNRLLVGATSALLALENAWGNGLFLNVILAMPEGNSPLDLQS